MTPEDFVRSHTAIASPPAPHRAAIRPLVRAKLIARTTSTVTPTAVRIGAIGCRKKLAFGATTTPARDGSASTTYSGLSSARLMVMLGSSYATNAPYCPSFLNIL